jgi:hypothetical protein
MIQLNLTYEESKMILDLGYDFSKVCVEWQFNFYPPGGDPNKCKITKWFKLGEYLVNPTLIGMLTHQEVDLLNAYTYDLEEVYADVKSYMLGDEYTPLIPIIPKAVLEACLPEYKGYDHDSVITYRWAGHTSMRSVCFCQFTDDKHMELEDFIHQHKSAYEAFMWCQENYPEDLKKKFSEVMQCHR